MTENYILPLKVSIGNTGDQVKAFVPYRENFTVNLNPSDVVSFGVIDSNEAIYYRGQETEGLEVGVAENNESIVGGTYNVETETFESGATYGFIQEGNEFRVIGEIPYVVNPGLGLQTGNVFTVRLKKDGITSRDQLPSGKICKITNTRVEGGYNEYNKNAFEEDGSLISVINVKANSVIEIQVKWEEDAEFEVYTFKIEAKMDQE